MWQYFELIGAAFFLGMFAIGTLGARGKISP